MVIRERKRSDMPRKGYLSRIRRVSPFPVELENIMNKIRYRIAGCPAGLPRSRGGLV